MPTDVSPHWVIKYISKIEIMQHNCAYLIQQHVQKVDIWIQLLLCSQVYCYTTVEGCSVPTSSWTQLRLVQQNMRWLFSFSFLADHCKFTIFWAGSVHWVLRLQIIRSRLQHKFWQKSVSCYQAKPTLEAWIHYYYITIALGFIFLTQAIIFYPF